MKNSLIKYICFGILGAILLFLKDLYHAHANCPGWVSFILMLIIPLVPMILRRLNKTQSRSFTALFKIGMIVSMTAIIIYPIIAHVHPNFFISPERQIELVDEKVNRMIMEFEGGNIDIFKMEENATKFFEPVIKDSLFGALLFAVFYFFFNTLFALILKTEKGGIVDRQAVS